MTEQPTDQPQSINLQPSEEKLVKPFKDTSSKRFPFKKIVLALLIVVAGGLTGYLLAEKKSASQPASSTTVSEQSAVKKGMVVGISDEKTFRDSAEGKLVRGGINGEGSHHLERPGGESQNVYLTSSVIDLDLFVGHKVKVWGETFAAQKAGWLMDVGKLEVLE